MTKAIILTLFFVIGLCFGIVASPYFSMPTVEATRINVEESHSIETGPKEKESPKDRVAEQDILVYDDRVIIKLNNPQWSRFTNTNSMDPVFDTEANAIQMVPKNKEDLKVGDIVSYESEYGTIIHRITETGTDSKGWYAVTKGDNNPSADPQKVRFNQIKRVVVAIVY